MKLQYRGNSGGRGFGQFLLNDGVIVGEEILLKGWVKEAGAPKDINGERINRCVILQQDKQKKDLI